MNIAHGWVPVALSSSLEPGTSAGTVVDGGELVVWRDTKGAAHVWEDRCPHRGMRMSFGFVRGDHIACLYHGWQYDSGGQCQYIPAHPDLDVPKTIRVPTYLSMEAAGIIWATLAADALALPEPAPVTEVTPVRSLYLDVSKAALRDALIALTPTAFTAGNAGAASIDAPSDDIAILSVGGDRLLLALQSLNPARSALHIVILGSPQIYRGAGQKHFSAWSESLRRFVEGAVVPGPALEVA